MNLHFTILFACFFLSGFAALLYQTAWTRELSFIFGTSEVAVIAVLAAYMGGLALGSAAAARFVPRVRRPVWTYGLLEFGIAACALSIPMAISLLSRVYVALFGGFSSWPWEVPVAAGLFQTASAFLLLMAPTALMGATLPLLARHAVRRDSEISSRIGGLYSVNTVGAIAGTLVAAFWLMPQWGLRTTVWIGAGVNVLVFALAVLASRGEEWGSAPVEPAAATISTTSATSAASPGSWILPVIALSGSLSFTLEVVWTRLLGHLLGASVQAFATMLASFLLGIALGSAVAARFGSSEERARIGFALSQVGVAVFTLLAFRLADPLAELSAAIGAGPAAPGASALLAIATLLPTTFCIGATFPLAIRILTPHADSAARSTARVYAWNTLGAIVGALGGGYFVLPLLGFVGTISVVVMLSLLLALFSVLRFDSSRARAPVAAVCMLLFGWLVFAPVAPPDRLLVSTPLERIDLGDSILFSEVGRSCNVLVTDQGSYFRLASNGLPEAGIRKAGVLPSSTRTGHWLGILPALLRPENEDLLIVGFGGGVALEFIPPSIKQIDVIELEPRVIDANRFVADKRAVDPLADPRIRIHLGDARGSLRLNEKRFGAIVSQPSHPWTSGASHLYTKEFFSLVDSRLRPDGVFIQWIGQSFLDESMLRSILATLLDVFPYVEMYQPKKGAILFAASPSPIDGLSSAARFLAEHADSVAPVGLESLEDFASTWTLGVEGTRRIAEDAVLTTDDHNLLATRSLHLGEGALSSEEMDALFEPLDPLIPLIEIESLDRFALVRGVAAVGQMERARELANRMSDEASRRVLLGEIAAIKGNRSVARRNFEKALSLSPGLREALAGLVLMRQSDWVANLDASLPAGADPFPELEALVRAWRSASQRDWETVASLDGALTSSDPRDLLFGPTTRLRIRQRLEIGGVEKSAEAQRLAERLLRRRWSSYDEWLRARAAAQSGDRVAVLASFQEIKARAASPAERREVEKRIDELLSKLPEDLRESLEASLSS